MSNVNDVLSAHDELRGTIDLHHKEGSFITNDRNMLGGILDLQDLEILDAMIHRTKMVSMDAADAPEKNRQAGFEIRAHALSRVEGQAGQHCWHPACQESLCRIAGK